MNCWTCAGTRESILLCAIYCLVPDSLAAQSVCKNVQSSNVSDSSTELVNRAHLLSEMKGMPAGGVGEGCPQSPSLRGTFPWSGMLSKPFPALARLCTRVALHKKRHCPDFSLTWSFTFCLLCFPVVNICVGPNIGTHGLALGWGWGELRLFQKI